jgi:hypothetical protein
MQSGFAFRDTASRVQVVTSVLGVNKSSIPAAPRDA